MQNSGEDYPSALPGILHQKLITNPNPSPTGKQFGVATHGTARIVKSEPKPAALISAKVMAVVLSE